MCLWHQVVLQVHKNASENDKDTKFIIKITMSEIKTELQLQSLKKWKLK